MVGGWWFDNYCIQAADRALLTDVSVAGINIGGFLLGTGGTLLNAATDGDDTTPSLATLVSLGGDFLQSFAFAFGRLYG